MIVSRDPSRGHTGVWRRRLAPAFAGCVLMAVFVSASAETVYGPPVSLQGGSVRTYLVMEDGVPSELGVVLDEAFLAAVPEQGAHGGITMPDGRSTFQYVLDMPEGNGTPFQHVMLDWNPLGHEPDGVFDKPHFDVHFYTISVAEREAIHPGDPDFAAKGARLPAPELIPEGYLDPGIPPVPRMGLHLVHADAPEFRAQDPEPFTQTVLYGTWDGRLIFVEPMVSMELLLQQPDLTFVVPVAERYDPEGYYPGAYGIRWDAAEGDYRIALNDFQWR